MIFLFLIFLEYKQFLKSTFIQHKSYKQAQVEVKKISIIMEIFFVLHIFSAAEIYLSFLGTAFPEFHP